MTDVTPRITRPRISSTRMPSDTRCATASSTMASTRGDGGGELAPAASARRPPRRPIAWPAAGWGARGCRHSPAARRGRRARPGRPRREGWRGVRARLAGLGGARLRVRGPERRRRPADPDAERRGPARGGRGLRRQQGCPGRRGCRRGGVWRSGERLYGGRGGCRLAANPHGPPPGRGQRIQQTLRTELRMGVRVGGHLPPVQDHRDAPADRPCRTPPRRARRGCRGRPAGPSSRSTRAGDPRGRGCRVKRDGAAATTLRSQLVRAHRGVGPLPRSAGAPSVAVEPLATLEGVHLEEARLLDQDDPDGPGSRRLTRAPPSPMTPARVPRSRSRAPGSPGRGMCREGGRACRRGSRGPEPANLSTAGPGSATAPAGAAVSALGPPAARSRSSIAIIRSSALRPQARASRLCALLMPEHTRSTAISLGLSSEGRGRRGGRRSAPASRRGDLDGRARWPVEHSRACPALRQARSRR